MDIFNLYRKEEPHGHQIRGMELCNEAMNLLGETVDDGWGGLSL